MNTVAMEYFPIPTLDPVQEVRIAAMHRGFLYQHLYAVGCLFQATAAGVTSVAIERDEDVEVVLPSGRIYVQVKSRPQPIIPSDINSALERFARLRVEHTEGRREGVAHFVIVANQPPRPSHGCVDRQRIARRRHSIPSARPTCSCTSLCTASGMAQP